MPKFAGFWNAKGIIRWSVLAGILTVISGCGILPKSEAQTG